MSETFDQMVDKVLEYNGTPRKRLFEYPYRADESRDLIRKAEELVRSIVMGKVNDPTHDEQTEIRLRNALANVLKNAMTYPEGVAHTILGRDMSNVIDVAVQAVLNTGLIEKVGTVHERPLVDRVEVIDSRGRAYSNYNASEVGTSLQDGGKTLKVFLQNGIDEW